MMTGGNTTLVHSIHKNAVRLNTAQSFDRPRKQRLHHLTSSGVLKFI